MAVERFSADRIVPLYQELYQTRYRLIRSSMRSASRWNATGPPCWSPRPAPARPRACRRRWSTAAVCCCCSRGAWRLARWRAGLRTSGAGRSAAKSAGTSGSSAASREARACSWSPKASSRRYLQDDPLLSDVTTVVVDEFHERSVHADLGLALVKQAWAARSDLRILVMSATLDPQPVSAFLDGCPIVDVPGTLHPLDDRIRARGNRRSGGHGMLPRGSGNILCFLPGAREIARDDRGLRAGRRAMRRRSGAAPRIAGRRRTGSRAACPRRGAGV